MSRADQAPALARLMEEVFMMSMMSMMRVLLMINSPIKCIGQNKLQLLPDRWKRSDLDDENPVMNIKMLMMMRKMISVSR